MSLSEKMAEVMKEGEDERPTFRYREMAVRDMKWGGMYLGVTSRGGRRRLGMDIRLGMTTGIGFVDEWSLYELGACQLRRQAFLKS